jgi:hypothetical protein
VLYGAVILFGLGSASPSAVEANDDDRRSVVPVLHDSAAPVLGKGCRRPFRDRRGTHPPRVQAGSPLLRQQTARVTVPSLP